MDHVKQLTSKMTNNSSDQDYAIKVLILEDVLEDAELMTNELENSGLILDHRVVDDEVSFESALQHFKPDIILADFNLPKTSGLEALVIAQREAPDVPFVFVTGTIGEEIAAETILNGASGLLLKKNMDKLPKTVTDLLQSKSVISQRLNSVLKRIDNRIKENVNTLSQIHAFMEGNLKGNKVSDDIKLTISQLKSIQEDLKDQEKIGDGRTQL